MRHSFRSLALLSVLCTAAWGCASEEAVRVTVPVEVDGGGLAPTQTDLGYTVRITRLRLALRDLQFTIKGEMHASLGRRLGDLLVPPVHAHPGHYAGGEVTGELRGAFLLDLPARDRAGLGSATMIAGLYQGLNLRFRAASAADGLPAGDPLLGHTAHVEGVAEKGGKAVPFEAILDVDEGAQLVGAPCDVHIGESPTTLALQVVTTDPFKGQSLFSGVDFDALRPGEGGAVKMGPGQPEHNVMRRSLQQHDFYLIRKR
jgi:hypothetical protein